MAAGEEENVPQDAANPLGFIVSGSERVLSPKEFQLKTEPDDIVIPDYPDEQPEAAIEDNPKPVAVIVESTEGKKYVMFTPNDKTGITKELPQMTTKTVMYLQQPDEERKCGCIIEELTKEGYDKTSRDPAETIALIEKGPPKLNNINWCNLKFMQSKYLSLEWLTGCEKYFRLFCWPCLLFSQCSTLWVSGGVPFTREFVKLCTDHKNTATHINSAIRFQIIKENIDKSKCRVRQQLIQKCEMNKKSIREVFKMATLLLQEKQDGFLDTGSLLTLAGQLDNVDLKTIPTLHNNVITILSRSLTEHIQQEINQAVYYACTIDTIGQKKIAATAKFVSSSGELTDRLINIFPIDFGLANIVQELKRFGEPRGVLIALCVGNVADMGSLVESETDRNYAICHSPIHRINQVLPTTFKAIKECEVFFLKMQGLRAAIRLCPQWIRSEIPNVELPQWEDNLVATAHTNKYRLMNFFQSNNLKIGPKSGEAHTIALGLSKSFEDLEFLFLLQVFAQLIPEVEKCFDIIYSTMGQSDILIRKLQQKCKHLESLKSTFESIWETVDRTSTYEKDWMPLKKARHVRSSKLTNYYKSLFENIVDVFVNMIRVRFTDIKMTGMVSFLRPGGYAKCSKNNKKLRGTLDMHRYNINKTRLKRELQALEEYKDLSSQTIEQMMITIEKTNMTRLVPELTKFVRLLLTIPYVSTSNQDLQVKLIEDVKKMASQKSTIPNVLQIHANKLTKLVETSEFTNRLLQLFSATHTI